MTTAYYRDDGGMWAEYELGALTADGEAVALEYAHFDVARGCTGDTSCFDDDSNIQRYPYQRRMRCTLTEQRRLDCSTEDRCEPEPEPGMRAEDCAPSVAR